MQMSIERLLPLVASYGAWVLATLLVASLGALAWLGRGRPFLVPSRWPGRIAAAGMLGVGAVAALGLWAVLGPMRPMLAQVRGMQRVVGRPAEDLAFREVEGDAPRRLSELRGSVVLVNLWATWCGPCRTELPGIDRLQRDYAARGLVVVTLSNEERELLRRFAAKYPMATLNVYASRLGWLEVGGRPVSIVIDRSGVVRACLIGRRSYAEFERTVRPYLEGAS